MRNRSLDWLVEPSFASFATCVILAVVIMGGAMITDGLKSGVFYDLLLGPASTATQIETASSTFSAISNTVLGNSTLNKLLFFGFWLMVGLAVYTIVMSFSYYTGGIVMFWEELHQINSRKKLLREQFKLRVLLQTIGLLLLIFFTVFFVKILLPFSLLCARISLGLWGNVSGLGYFTAGLVILLLSFHIYTTLFRFAALRTRVFGSPLE